MSKKELLLVKSYLKEHLEKDFIIVSLTSFVSLILFAKKSSDKLHFCVDYRKLNKFIKKNSYSIFFIIDLMTRFFKAKFLIKIDIRHAFNRIRMTTEKNEDLTTFRTCFEAYKYRVLSFELINKSITFQNFINDIFMKYLNDFVVVYLNDILIYSNSIENHRRHVKKCFKNSERRAFRSTSTNVNFMSSKRNF